MGRGSLGLQQGMRVATAQQAEEAALRNHPETQEQIASDEMSFDNKVDWVQSICPELNEADCLAAVHAMEEYSDMGSSAIHKNNPDNDPAVASKIEAIDKVLTSKNAPIYKGELFRGITWRQSEEELRARINGGIWKEPGITSFSSKKSTATKMTKFGDGIQVILHVPEGKNISGVPFQHLSVFGKMEAEVLAPSTVKDRGWKITKSKWGHDQNGRKTVELELEENIRRIKK